MNDPRIVPHIGAKLHRNELEPKAEVQFSQSTVELLTFFVLWSFQIKRFFSFVECTFGVVCGLNMNKKK